MLARTSTLRHPSGVSVRTPLLVPSFSSKGFIKTKGKAADLDRVFDVASEFLENSMLVSAYDIHYGHLSLKQAPTKIVFVDSGGYEVANDYDAWDPTLKSPTAPQTWDEERLRTTYKTLLTRFEFPVGFVLVNFDHPLCRTDVSRQILQARQLLANFPGQLHDVILKPETATQSYLQIPSLLAHVNELADFDIVGVVDKELGKSFLERMTNIARLREAMDAAGITAPIHVFGTLEPVATCLYFLAGAEIFDGLTWLRYSYLNDTTIYKRDYGLLCLGIHQPDSNVIAKALIDNIYYLSGLERQMRDFLLKRDFAKFGSHSAILEKAHETLTLDLGGA